MKYIKYLLLLVVLLPITAFAEAIHLTQSVIEQAITNQNSVVSSYQIEYYYDEHKGSSTFVLFGDEYTLDEDIDLHKQLLTADGTTVLNLNGYDITQDLDAINSTYSFVTISNDYVEMNVIDLTINGPGNIYAYDDGPIQVSIENLGGTLTLNNVELKAALVNVPSFSNTVTNVNNCKLNGYGSLSPREMDFKPFDDYTDTVTINDTDIKIGMGVTSEKKVDITINNSNIEGGLLSQGQFMGDSENITELLATPKVVSVKVKNSEIDGIVYAAALSNIELENVELKGSFYLFELGTLVLDNCTIDSKKSYINQLSFPMMINYYFDMESIMESLSLGGNVDCFGLLTINNTTIQSDSYGIVTVDPVTSEMENIGDSYFLKSIQNSKINADLPILAYGQLTKLVIEDSDLIVRDYNSLLTMEDPSVVLKNTHLQTMTTSDAYPVVVAVTKSSSTPQDYFANYIGVGQYYYSSDLAFNNGGSLEDNYDDYGEILPIKSSNNNQQSFYEKILTDIKSLSIIGDDPKPKKPKEAPGESSEPVYNMYGINTKDLWVLTESQTYETEENTQYVVENNNEVVIPVSGDVRLLETVEVNGQLLTSDQYTVVEMEDNKIGIKISDTYLQTLGDGNYEVKVSFVNGTATTTLNVAQEDPNKPKEEKDNKEDVKGEVENPKTGLFNYLMLLIPLAIVGIIYIKIRKNTMYKNI